MQSNRKRDSTGAIRSSQLEWVQRNRRPPESAPAVGQVIREKIDPRKAGDNANARDVFEAVSGIADDEFRLHCRFDDTRGTELTLLVNPADLLYHIRTQWHAVLVRHLQDRCPASGITRVTFRPVDHEQWAARGVAFPRIDRDAIRRQR